MTVAVSPLIVMKEMLDDDPNLRRRFRSAANVHGRSTSASEVEHWRRVLDEAEYEASPDAIKAALKELTITLLPDSEGGMELAAERDAGYEVQPRESVEPEAAEAPLEGEVVEEGGWDADRAHEVSQQALQYIARHTQDIDLDVADRTEADRIEEEMWAAAEVGDLEAYINATRSWASAWRRAAKEVMERE